MATTTAAAAATSTTCSTTTSSSTRGEGLLMSARRQFIQTLTLGVVIGVLIGQRLSPTAIGTTTTSTITTSSSSSSSSSSMQHVGYAVTSMEEGQGGGGGDGDGSGFTPQQHHHNHGGHHRRLADAVTGGEGVDGGDGDGGDDGSPIGMGGEGRRRLSAANDYFAARGPRNSKEEALMNLIEVVFPGLRDIDFTLPVPGYYINLDRSHERRAVMDRTFGRIWGPRLHRHRGIDYRNHTQVIEVLGGGQKAREIAACNAPNLAAILSHLTAVKEAWFTGAQVALITEDDIGPYLMPHWTVGLEDIVKALKTSKTHWDTVMLWWATEEGTAPPPGATWVGENLIKSPYLWGGSAYLISRTGMQKVMEKHFPGGSPDSPPVLTFEGDVVIDGSGYYGSLMTENYIVYPGMFITHSKQSTIQTSDWHSEFHTKVGAGHWVESVKRWQARYLPELK